MDSNWKSRILETGGERLIQGLSSLSGRVMGSEGCLLTFHRAAPAAEWADLPNRNFYLNLEFLDALLGYLSRSGREVVTIGEMLRRSGEPGSSAGLVNFSVDDCYIDTWQHVVPLFRRHGMPVTLFVTTGIPDGTLSLSWSGLETIIARERRVLTRDGSRDVATPEEKRRAYSEIWADWERSDFGVDREYADFCARHGADPETIRPEHAITWEMLEELSQDPLVEIGAHTVSHPRISALSEAGAYEEIFESGRRLRERLGVPALHFAFPYGRSGDCGARDFDLVRKAGFDSASTTRKGLFSSRQGRFVLPRNTVNGGHQNFALIEASLSGASGIAARVLGRV